MPHKINLMMGSAAPDKNVNEKAKQTPYHFFYLGPHKLIQNHPEKIFKEK